ncbi:MAG: peptide deformylase [Candidatus Aminicenantes bacterium]|nr:MAG: peptide deformylase [Candidatus Aminicenantes bacterium]
MEDNEDPILEIVTIGDPILNRKADKIRNIDQHVCDLAQRMVKTMHSAPGVGLAAPQVNQSIQLITVDISLGENNTDLIVLANPEILQKEGETVLEEGCLSVPGINEKVTRPYRVVVKGIDLDGKEKIIEAEDLLARIFCHEVDHINGKLFIEHLSHLKKSLIRKKLQKQQNEDIRE